MRILLGVCGSIAAYKACALVSELVQRGDDVHVILTDAAQRFVAPLTFSALTRNRVTTSLWSEDAAIAHIDLVRQSEVLLIAPATAQTIAKIALGLADDVLTNAALAARIPIIIAPAMNSAMYEHAATQEHLDILRTRGVHIVEPESGFLAEREIGVGRLADQVDIIQAIDAVHTRTAWHESTHSDEAITSTTPAPTPEPVLQKTTIGHVLITAGPTREPIDPVRFISNAATGATGIELARVAQERGATVTLILGPTAITPPAGVQVEHVTTAAEMLHAALAAAHAHTPDLVIATAAVSDHRPSEVAEQKLKKGRDLLELLQLTTTEDVVTALRKALPDAFVVGFAAETEDHDAHAQRKLIAKNLDAIVVNDVASGRGFGIVENHCTVHFADGDSIDTGVLPKDALARKLFEVFEVHAK